MAAACPAVCTNHGGGQGREKNGAYVYSVACELLGIPSSNTYIDYLARPDGRLKG